MWILPSCSCISTTVWLHHLDFNGEKVKWELLKGAAGCFKQILVAAFYKTAAQRPLTSHLTNHPRKTNQNTRHCWRYKNEWRSVMDTDTWTQQCWPNSQKLVLSAHWTPSLGLTFDRCSIEMDEDSKESMFSVPLDDDDDINAVSKYERKMKKSKFGSCRTTLH